MQLIPKYSLEFNKILNPKFQEMQQIKNFSSLISDKDRFFILAQKFQKILPNCEKYFGFKFFDKYEFYVVRSELFKSFSEPITIEYNFKPEEMILFLFKEIIKVTINQRFMDEIQRDEFINSFVRFCLNKFLPTENFEFDILDKESLRMYKDYKKRELNFSKKDFKHLLNKEIDEDLNDI